MFTSLSCEMVKPVQSLIVGGTVHWQSVFYSLTIVFKSLVWWVWELLSLRRNAYLTLTPPAGSSHLNLSSDLVRARGSHGGSDGELLRWRVLLCVTIGTSIGACIWKKVTIETPESCTSAALAARHKRQVPKRGRRALEIRTSEAMGEIYPRIAALRGERLAISPIQEITGQSSARPCAAAACATPALNPRETQTQSACTNTMNTLALSGIILTVDIPPSVPERVDDKSIMELSEMLQRW